LFGQKVSNKMTNAQNISTKGKSKGDLVIQMLKDIEAKSWEEGWKKGWEEGIEKGIDLTLSVMKYLKAHPETNDAAVMELFDIKAEKLQDIRQLMA
jgi:hypothetical protein